MAAAVYSVLTIVVGVLGFVAALYAIGKDDRLSDREARLIGGVLTALALIAFGILAVHAQMPETPVSGEDVICQNLEPWTFWWIFYACFL